MKISTLFYTLRQGVRNIFRNKLFSMASIATIAACLFLFGILYSVVMNFQHIVKNAQEGVSVTVFFNEGTSQERIDAIGEQIKARVEVSDIKYTTADEAWAWFQEKYFEGKHTEGFPTNPLEGYENYEVFLNDVSMQDALVTWLQSLPDVRLVKYSSLTANALTGVNLIVAYASVGIIVILLGVSIFLISNTVTIGISVRQEEISIMKYIGATDFFTRAPFVIEGMLIGAIGSGIPLLLIYFIYNDVVTSAMSKFQALSSILNFLTVQEVFHVLVPVSLGIGIGIGFLGSFTTVRKHLRV
ncbi:MAG: ABC transporter permease [Lachnospiraceae bacterium]|jgi:cell division transport system permease protein|nr:ABC transporter permease [Lachnospiraceae bacterium]MED9806793.1 permease-like cell division protein FtsX [Lachnospiraceae bacterium]